jgi:uncharacterized delta-60 repeat protein
MRGAAAAAVLAALATTANATGTAGSLDAGFGGTGVVLVDGGVTDMSAGATGVAVQSDGLVLVAGYRSTGATTPSGGRATSWSVRRYQPDGGLDSSYGTAGERLLFGANGLDSPSGLVLDAAGRAVVAGEASFAETKVVKGKPVTTSVRALAVARLTVAGALDSTFGTGGVVRLPATVGSWGLFDSRGLLVEPTGKIVLSCGVVSTKGTVQNYAIALARLTSGGALDSTFGGDLDRNGSRDGIVVHDPYKQSNSSTSERPVGSPVRQSTGNLVVAVDADPYGFDGTGGWHLYRFTSSGDLDGSFSPAAEPVAWHADDLAVDASDRLIVCGQDSGTDECVVVRYLPNGARDASFGSSGEAHPALGDLPIRTSMTMDGSGRILLATSVLTGGAEYDGITARLLGDGSLDADYGLGGLGQAVGETGKRVYLGNGVAVSPDGAIHAIGGRTQLNGSDIDWVIARWLGS